MPSVPAKKGWDHKGLYRIEKDHFVILYFHELIIRQPIYPTLKQN